MMAGAGGAMRATGGARQPSGFNNSVRGARVNNDCSPTLRARGADDGGRRRRDASYGWRATAIRFRQFGEGVSHDIAR